MSAWTVVPVAAPLYVVGTGIPSFGALTNPDRVADALDSLECVEFVAHQVFGLLVDLEDVSNAPHGYLCARGTYMQAEWRPMFTAASPDEARKAARKWVAQRLVTARSYLAKSDIPDK